MKILSNENKPAFPFVSKGVLTTDCSGLTKREYLAALAMQSFIVQDKRAAENPSVCAEWALAHADALLKELSK